VVFFLPWSFHMMFFKSSGRNKAVKSDVILLSFLSLNLWGVENRLTCFYSALGCYITVMQSNWNLIFEIWATMSSSFMFVLPFLNYLLGAYLWFSVELIVLLFPSIYWVGQIFAVKIIEVDKWWYFSFLLSYKFILLIFGQLI
jgi:hypothetical protein